MTRPDSGLLVAKQYEDYPYPARDPEDERKRLIGTWLDELELVNHHCFCGQQRFDARFRVLVAGGGTGDGTIFLAEQLRGKAAEIVHLDFSQASLAVAKERAEVRGLHDIRWVYGSLLDLPTLELGKFDYINCAGVLHHLADPKQGMQALMSALAEGGAMAIMLYGLYGRTGVYHLQEVFRLMHNGAMDSAQKMADVRAVVSALPRTNWFRRNEDLFAIFQQGVDAEIYDLLLHAQDRAYSVPDLYAWIEDECGLHMTFSDVHRARLPYMPDTYLSNAPDVMAKVRALPVRSQHAIAELLGGNLSKHCFYATLDSNTHAPYGNLEYIPFFIREAHRASGKDLAQVISAHRDRPFLLTHNQSGLTVSMDPGLYAKSIFQHLDGVRTFGEIFDLVRQQRASPSKPPTDELLFAEFRPWFEVLNSIDRLLLRKR